MKSVTKFNALNRTTVSREQINSILQIAKDEEQIHIVKSLNKLLVNYPDEQKFEWENPNQAIEIIPNSLLSCLDCDSDTTSALGLGKAVSPDAIYQMITDQIIEALEKPLDNWQKEWGSDVDGYLLAYNFITKNPYRSINQLVLNPHVLAPVYPILKNPYFLTFAQIDKLKGKVKKGSKGHQVTYYNFTYSYNNELLNLSFKTNDENKFISWIKQARVLQRLGLSDSYLYSFVNENKFAFLKYYNVFNGDDVEGIDFDLDNFSLKGKLTKIENHHETLPICEAIIASYPATKPKFTFGGESAHFNPGTDTINMPNLSQFKYVQAYYTTYFHEMIHSTGVETRLNRDLSGRIKGNADQKKGYYFEELIAELGAIFLCSQSGILHYTKRNSLAYLKHYRDGLVSILKEDNKFIFKASTQSQKASDFLLENVDFDKISVQKVRKVAKKAAKKIDSKPTNLKEQFTPAARKRTKNKEVVKVDVNGQTSLFGAKKKKQSKKGMKGIVDTMVIGAVSALLVDEKPTEVKTEPTVTDQQNAKTFSSNPNVKKIGERSVNNSQFYTVAGEVGKFLQAVEKKPSESVVITLDGEQGAGKTTTLYHFMNDFASAGNRSLFISLEEHIDSSLAADKTNKYISEKSKPYLDATSDLTNVEVLYNLVQDYDVIFIDSWQKLVRMIGNIKLDEDLRKKFDGKVFVIIFQQTTTGRTKGGSEVVFDGDIIIKMVKEASFQDNYAYFDKNRYTKVPLETIRYNIANGKCYNPQAKEEPIENIQTTEKLGFSFNIT